MTQDGEPGTWRKGIVADGPEVREYDGQGMRRLVAMARNPEQARRIVSALQAVEAMPQRFVLRADGTYEDTGQPHVSVRQWKFEHLDLSNAHVTTLGTVQWLDHVFQFLRQAGREEWPTEAVPVPPWRQQ